MKHAIKLLCLAIGLWSSLAQAIAPESGMYWDPAHSGGAFYIEHQEGRVGVAIYAFDRETGAAEIYVSGGLLSEEGAEAQAKVSPLPPMDGMQPIHRYQGDLYRATHGQPLTFPLFPGRPAQAEKVGTIMLSFLNAGGITYAVSLDDDAGHGGGLLERFAFGHGRYGDELGSRHVFDLRGQWVFVDESDAQSPPMRFDFIQRLPEDAPFQVGSDAAFAVSFVDPVRNARMACAMQPEGDSGDPNLPFKRPGCELYVEDELVLAANLQDVGLDRIQAYRGGLPAPGQNPYRRAETVIGLRVVLPPPAAEPETPGND